MRIFLDANILFSGAQSQSRMRAFLAVLTERAKLVTNEYAIEEARRNLSAKSPDALKNLERLVQQCDVVPQLLTDLEIDLASKDVPILGGAIAGGATHLLTGDERDFGKFWGKTIRGVKTIRRECSPKNCG
jgi:predicted nucleic acid-binding protein